MADFSALDTDLGLDDDAGTKKVTKYRLNIDIFRHTRRRLRDRCQDIAEDRGMVSFPATKLVRALIVEFLNADSNDEWVKRVVERSLKSRIED